MTAVDTVVVTARRSEEKLQDVPTAITAVTSKQLETLKPRTLQDLTGLSPNVFIGMVGAGAGSSAIYIRGLGYSDIEKGENPAVGLLIDDVVIGTNTAQLVDSFDISQVEIDRGPQGIFYGKNTTAGAISIHRSRPTHAWGLDASAGYGDHNQQVERVIVNAPLGDQVGLKLGFSHRYHDGYNNNVYTHDNHYGNDELNTGLIALDWKPTSTFDALLEADFTHEDGEGTPVQLGDLATAKFLAGSGLSFNSIGSPYIPGVTKPLGVRQVANDFPDRNLLSQQRYSLNMRWDSPIGQINSITAYIHQTDDAEQDFDGSCGVSELGGKVCNVLPNTMLGNSDFPLGGFLHTSRPQLYTQFTEEDRLTHEFGPVKVMAGVYYFHHEISAVQHTRTNYLGVPVTATLSDQISGETNDSISGFINFDYAITSRLHVSAGMRYIDETTHFHNAYHLMYFPGVGPVDFPQLAFQQSKSWSKAITRVSVDYKLTDNNMIYFSRADGFRGGGFSPRSTLSESSPGQSNYSPGANYAAYAPETNTAYEIGSKNTFFDNQLTLNVDGFWTDVVGHQQSQVVITPNYGPGTNTYIVNIPKVEIKGAELEAVLRPHAIPGLTLSANFGYQDAKITQGKVPGVEAPIGPGATAGPPGSVYDETGQPLERVPKTQFGLRGDYVYPIGPGKLDVNLGYKWQDQFIFGTLAGIPDTQPAYGLLDASVSYAWSHYKVTVSGKNLTGVDYRVNTLPPVFFQGWGEPTTVFVELQTHW